MTQQPQLDGSDKPLHKAYACRLANRLDGAGDALRILVNEASRIERARHLQATPSERFARRADPANGYKPKTVLTPMGEACRVRMRTTNGLEHLNMALKRSSRAN